MFGLSDAIFECCNPSSIGEPEYLHQDPRHISSRAASNLFHSPTNDLKLFFERWRSDRHEWARAVVFAHHGEMEHSGWYNGLATRLASVGCMSFVPDAQGFGQSDGARGYFENFDDLVRDFVAFCKMKWAEVKEMQPQHRPGLVFLGKGFGALVVVRGLLELQPCFREWTVTPAVVLVSPAFQFASYIGDQRNNSCGLNTQCQTQSLVAYAPTGDEAPPQKLEHMSQWFPKMIVTQPVDPELVSRDPQVVDRMNRDCLIFRQGYRARVLSEIIREQSEVLHILNDSRSVFEKIPALILHGTADRLFDVHGSHNVHSAWCDVARASGIYPRLKIYDGAFHMLLNEPNKDEVLNDIVNFIASKTIC
eukprot:gnl/TRDRNA2_/TRDRNA2_163796_c0_seq1.p1 gnl/TRDRNA2_/TRDRNA2_163796_c0~~gnl/TRDRNA2_/TRDRNA2_163796_c0_seq1.p1  ORF type:complete len:364 (-),score=53.01 gnl/TRDRNA2_/TRDRNA2_163796_c0_seq1:77-1168(-)